METLRSQHIQTGRRCFGGCLFVSNNEKSNKEIKRDEDKSSYAMRNEWSKLKRYVWDCLLFYLIYFQFYSTQSTSENVSNWIKKKCADPHISASALRKKISKANQKLSSAAVCVVQYHFEIHYVVWKCSSRFVRVKFENHCRRGIWWNELIHWQAVRSILSAVWLHVCAVLIRIACYIWNLSVLFFLKSVWHIRRVSRISLPLFNWTFDLFVIDVCTFGISSFYSFMHSWV